MTERPALIDRFLTLYDWNDAERTALPIDCSFRRYERLAGQDGTMLLMDAPPPKEDVRPFTKVARLLLKLGYSVPEIHGEDVDNGFLLVEDFGSATFTKVLKHRLMTERDLYGLAIDMLADLHKKGRAEATTDIPPYSDELLMRESMLFIECFLPMMKYYATDEYVEAYQTMVRQLIQVSRAGVPDHLVLRDFHVDNLMMLRDREGLSQLGILDFQDAVVGPITYDVVSLLRDARRDVPEKLAVEMASRYLNHFPDQDPMSFMASCAAMAVQRNLKVLGIFARQSTMLKNHTKLKHMPRLWRMIDEDAKHPAMAFFKSWLDRYVVKEFEAPIPAVAAKAAPAASQ